MRRFASYEFTLKEGLGFVTRMRDGANTSIFRIKSAINMVFPTLDY